VVIYLSFYSVSPIGSPQVGSLLKETMPVNIPDEAPVTLLQLPPLQLIHDDMYRREANSLISLSSGFYFTKANKTPKSVVGTRPKLQKIDSRFSRLFYLEEGASAVSPPESRLPVFPGQNPNPW
jgi:hypothetical protein